MLIKPHADAAGMTVTEYMIAYNSGKIENPALDEEAMHDRSCRATGHDTSNRLIGVSAHLNSVDLNSLLYQYESDIASLLDMCFDGQLQSESSTAWRQKAEVRKERMNQHLYNAEDGVFHDYNFIKKAQAPYANATSLYPLYAKLATQEQAESIIRTLLPKLECAGGVAASSEASR
ncbi:hypothetical protein H6768_01640 [Candidatus Peribacteria bacterium]|nr:hypothetical protein [Candidatus Peribacteria bacterium]